MKEAREGGDEGLLLLLLCNCNEGDCGLEAGEGEPDIEDDDEDDDDERVGDSSDIICLSVCLFAHKRKRDGEKRK